VLELISNNSIHYDHVLAGRLFDMTCVLTVSVNCML